RPEKYHSSAKAAANSRRNSAARSQIFPDADLGVGGVSSDASKMLGGGSGANSPNDSESRVTETTVTLSWLGRCRSIVRDTRACGQDCGCPLRHSRISAASSVL